eukprot:scaffold82018_cov42-Phaeocystis_antarctica.AAC.1
MHLQSTILVIEHNLPHTSPRPHAHARPHPRPHTLSAAHPRPHPKQVDLTAPTLLMLTQPELPGCDGPPCCYSLCPPCAATYYARHDHCTCTCCSSGHVHVRRHRAARRAHPSKGRAALH